MLGWYGLTLLQFDGDFLELGRVRIWDRGSMQRIAKDLAHLSSTTQGTTGALGAGTALGAETLDDAAGALLGVEVLCCGTELALLPN